MINSHKTPVAYLLEVHTTLEESEVTCRYLPVGSKLSLPVQSEPHLKIKVHTGE